ncbi:Peroxisomal carnitine O-octanoyltransferase [Blattella germanica]|nr:Peroxisomal carnitine O-octanoyltransferase [Blattella germanica]
MGCPEFSCCIYVNTVLYILFYSLYFTLIILHSYNLILLQVTKMSLADELLVIPKNESTRTFEQDESLPSLPVPSLQHTLERYLDSVKPFLTDEEMAETIRLVSTFEKGIGRKLHSELLKRAKKERNWLERWWEDLAYLNNRSPLLPFSHMIGIGVSNKLIWGAGEFTNQIKNAAMLCHYTSQAWLLLREQRLRPNTGQVDKKHFSMYGFRRLFNCVRIPGEVQDSLAMYFRTTSEGNCPSHVIVLCGGRIFCLNALDAKGGLLSPPEWECQLTFIKEECRRRKGPGLPLLTCTDRTTWAKNRLHLESLGAQNATILNTIDCAMFVLSLDSDPAPTSSDIGQLSLCGDLTNRWADKSLDCVVFENGVEGILSEHTAYDGMVSIYVMLYVNMKCREMNWEWKGSREVKNLPEPEELILKADAYIDQQLEKAIPAPVYETATTREFYHGRTETVRSCTPEVVEFVKAMLSPNSSNNLVYGHSKSENKNPLAINRLNVHCLSMVFTMCSQIVHFGGNGNFVLSTSLTGYTPLGGGVAPMCTNGYGCFYNICSDSIDFTITVFRESTETSAYKFFNSLTQSLGDMKRLMEGAPGSSKL